jgi:signal transduction histidine kinase
MLILPQRAGLAWIAGFGLITALILVANLGWPNGLLAAPMYAAGYFFFGIFALSMAEADAARRKSQALADELQAANTRLREYAARIEELAVIEERGRLAREMHDTLGHRLTVAAVQLEGAQRLIAAAPDRAATMIGTVRQQVREALAELRHTVAALGTPLEADLSLTHSLARLATTFEQATGLAVHQLLPDDLPELPGPLRLALYRAAQEALTNVQRHACASQVWLVVNVQDASISLLVSDDGKGVSLSAGQPGYGLRGLRERAAQLGGELHIEPRRGGGTELTFRAPLEAGG